MSIVLGGAAYEVPGVRTLSWRDDPRVRRTPKVNRRTQPVRLVVIHATCCAISRVQDAAATPAADPYRWSDDAAANARDGAGVSWDATVRRDGVVLWQNDPVESFTWHANDLNPTSVGIELEQGADHQAWAVQQPALVGLVRFLVAYFDLKALVPYHADAPDRRVLARLTGVPDPALYGVVGHRNANPHKSDPGDPPYAWLRAAGFAPVDLALGQDLGVARGLPGPPPWLVAALAASTAMGAVALWRASASRR